MPTPAWSLRLRLRPSLFAATPFLLPEIASEYGVQLRAAVVSSYSMKQINTPRCDLVEMPAGFYHQPGVAAG